MKKEKECRKRGARLTLRNGPAPLAEYGNIVGEPEIKYHKERGLFVFLSSEFNACEVIYSK